MRVYDLHAPLKVIQRSKGRSATAAAAYRAAERIECQHTGEIHDFTRKTGVEQKALLFPAQAPDFDYSRASLWNAAEKNEKRKDAQTAREIEVGMPHEFSEAQRREAGMQIGTLLVAKYNVAVDMCWHKPGPRSDERNHHIHIMFTARHFENGEWAKKKDRTLDDQKTGRKEVSELRERIAGILNNIAARDRLPVYVEHTSYADRGLNREATQHMGPTVTQDERRGKRTDIGDENRARQRRNKHREQLEAQLREIQLSIARQSGQPDPLTPQERWLDFYKQTADQRHQLLHVVNQRYGAERQATMQRLSELDRSINHENVFIRIWRGFTGRTAREKAEMDDHALTLQKIQRRQWELEQQFERDRLNRMEDVHKQIREDRRQAEEWYVNLGAPVPELVQSRPAVRMDPAPSLEQARLQEAARAKRQAMIDELNERTKDRGRSR